MDVRLFLLFSVLVLTLIIGVIAILFITGTFTAGLDENKHLVENELNHAADSISQQYGELSAHAIDFSRELSRSMEANSVKYGISLNQLNEHPEILEEMMASEFERTLFTLQKSDSSGAFFILNATINPTLENAEHSRAGIYIKNMEPNIISSSAPNFIVLRGMPGISRQNSLPLHTQWKMEFYIMDTLWYHRPLEAARANPDLPLSRLYYWDPVTIITGCSEEVMLCTVPLIDSKGNVFGVCGIEISSMLFKLTHLPDNQYYNRLFCLLAQVKDDQLDFARSMIAGGYSAKIMVRDGGTLKISTPSTIYTYSQEGSRFLGLHKPIQLYPSGSAFGEENWVAAVMIPEADIVTSITRLNLLLIALLMLLVVAGIAAALVLSRRFIKPINEGLDIIKSADLSRAPRTKVAEIDDLIDYLAVRNRELSEKARQENLSLSLLDEFLANTKDLSPAERAVYDLYIKGHTAKEIAEILSLSINTIKTHNKRIYQKLNVNSREELLLYISMLQEIGAALD